MVAFDPERDPLEVLADDFTTRCRRGESPSIAEYVSQYPELAEQIEVVFPSISLLENLVRQDRSDRNRQQTQTAFTSSPIQHIGDCRIVREISRGGMGIVYEAVQESLDRRVAIKVLPTSSLASPNQLERFHREAQVAASLHHTNIVAVFGVGQQDGLHYYLMQFIDGVGMDHVLAQLRRLSGAAARSAADTTVAGHNTVAESAAQSLRDGSFARGKIAGPTDVARELSTRHDEAVDKADPEATARADRSPATVRHGVHYWRSVATIGVQLARALDYAHLQGVLHRDIKPANLLLDTDGAAWITDFGLAKNTEASDLTKTGDIMGTLRYMAPEQLQGAASPASDLYSLGLSLYELLTLEPALPEDDQGRLIQLITSGAPPLRPRRINPHIPADLETIVLKAMAHEAAHRYSTAAALADDLQRFLEDRPIQARRVKAPERLWRWCKRNPAMAGLAGLALLLLILVATSTSIGYVRTTAALGRESLQRQRAETTLGISLEALDQVYRRFAPDRMFEPPSLTVEDADGGTIEVPTQAVLSKDTAALLEDILKFYNRFAGQDSDNEQLRAEAAKANRRIGDIQSRLGQFAAAEAAYQRAIEQYTVLSATTGNARFETEIARIHNELGNVYRAMQQFEASRAAFQASLDLLNSARTLAAPARFELARTYYFLGLGSQPDLADGPPGPNRGPGLPPGPPPRGPGIGPNGPPLEQPWGPPGGELRRDGRRPEGPTGARPDRRPPRETTGPDRSQSLASLDKAIALLTALETEQPTIPEYPYLLALCYRQRAHGRQAEDLSKPIEILLRLAEKYPAVADYRFQLAETYATVEPLHLPHEDLEWAASQLREAMRYADALTIEHPHIPEYARARAHTCHKLATVIRRQAGRQPPNEAAAMLDEAEALFREAVRVHLVLLDQFPTATSYQFWLPTMERSLARSLADRGKLEQAASVLESSIAGMQGRTGTIENPWFARRTQFEQLRMLASLYERQGRHELASDTNRQAESFGGRNLPPDDSPNRARPGPLRPRPNPPQ